MNLKVTIQNKEYIITSSDELLEFFKNGYINKDTIVFDITKKKNIFLYELVEVQKLSLIPDNNIFIKLDSYDISEKFRKKKIFQNLKNILLYFSMFFLLISIVEYFISTNLICNHIENTPVIRKEYLQTSFNSVLYIILYICIWVILKVKNLQYFLFFISIFFLIYKTLELIDTYNTLYPPTIF